MPTPGADGATALAVASVEEATSVFVDPAAYAEPDRFHRAAAFLRANAPVALVTSPRYRPFYAVTRHADVQSVERNSAGFLNGPRTFLVPDAYAAVGGGKTRSLVHLDGAEHRSFRGITVDWFNQPSVARLETTIRSKAQQYIDRMTEMGGACDFATDVAMGFPLSVILSLLGLPESEFDFIANFTLQAFGGEDAELRKSADPSERAAMMANYYEYFGQLAANRRANPTDDLATVIATARDADGNLLDDFDVVSYFLIIATAGHESTSSTIAGGLHALIEHPDQMAIMRSDPDAIPTGVEEMLRWVTPVKEFMRTAASDQVLGEVQIAEGESVYLAYLSANRDEAVFENPFEFDVRRKPNRHLAFGFGPHFCLGAHLARLELRVFFEELLARVDDFDLTGPAAQAATTFVGSFKHLPISYTVR